MRPVHYALLAAALAGPVLAGPASAQVPSAVPFVGCASDGQTGPMPAPAALPQGQVMPHSGTAGLAFYVSDQLGILAPQGWHCFGLYGSNGSILLVTPQVILPSALLNGSAVLTGPAVQFSESFGDTSGRFEVAEAAARLLPAKRAFVEALMKEEKAWAPTVRFGPFPGDKLTYRGNSETEFTTPAGQKGAGTMSRLAPGPYSISGIVSMAATNDMLRVEVRLPPGSDALTAAIIQSVRGNSR